MPELRRQSAETAARILRPEQSARLKQIVLQLQGARALSRPETARLLGLTEEQQQKIAAIREEAHKAFARLFADGAGRGEEAGQRVKELRQRIGEQTMSVLTDAQRAQWKELTGEPFTGDVHFGGFGHGRGHAACRN